MSDPGAHAGGARGSVLVVDDERTIAEVVSRYLERAGYETRSAADGPEAVSVARLWRPDLIVLDMMLPGFDGLEVMRRLQQDGVISGVADGRPAVILLTARGEEPDRIIGLRRGADDYVVKPFSPAEIVARVDAVLRRTAPSEPATQVDAVEIGGLLIDPAARTVEVEAHEVILTAREFDLLFFLASHAGRAFTRDQLMEEVWNASPLADTGTVTVHVRRLRAKIEPDPAHPRFLETVRGVGYRFRAATRASSRTGTR